MVSHACSAKTAGGHGAYKLNIQDSPLEDNAFGGPPPSPHVEMRWLWRCNRVPISLADALALAVAALCWFIFNEPVSVLVA
jgi:hypothetical protein